MDDLEITLVTLQKWADDPSLIENNARAKSLVAKIHREGARGSKKSARDERRERDRTKIEATGRASGFSSPRALSTTETPVDLERARLCPVCRASFSRLHPFYHAYCPDCAELNWTKRHQSADLRGRIALITGGRIKIGLECALKLLRCGARVIVSTRFAADAWKRYALQEDFEQWRERLEIVALDLRFLSEVERFCAHLNMTLPHLDILINNAAQTISRPPEFYAHLLESEAGLTHPSNQLKGVRLEEGASPAPTSLSLDSFFPPNRFDVDGQQLDLRPSNSWTAHIGEVETLEAATCYVVGALAPFVLTGHLRPLLKRSPHARRFVIQASAMDGNFSRASKTSRHPHTNMTKAALNMMVRTSAPDLARDGIFCNAVDTGWITDENPHEVKERLRDEGFVPPLDSVDGAARLLDPIFCGITSTEPPMSGHFLKDFVPHEW